MSPAEAQHTKCPPMAISTDSMSFNKTGSWRFLQPFFAEKLSPCRERCPLGTDLPRVISLIAEKRFEQAFELITETNPLPGVTGRVCYHPCEGSCSRKTLDAGVSVQTLERFVSEFCLDLDFEQAGEGRHLGESIGIIGSGPAGLSCGYFLARKGCSVTIYEAEEAAGGMLRLGIPSYRLPRRILDRELDRIMRLGISLELNCRVGHALPFESVRRRHDAVFVATGAHRSQTPSWQEEAHVLSGLEFLRRVNLGQSPLLGKLVLIIGGGNTALDAARTALRLGSEPVIVYRRSRPQMPAHESEILDAESEGIDFLYLASPLVVRKTWRGLEVEFQEMELGPPDKSGRRTPVPIDGFTFTLEADSVIVAIGEQPDLSFLIQQDQEGVFVGGDAQSGPSMVAKAMSSGRQAAKQIGAFLGHSWTLPGEQLPSESFVPESVNQEYFSRVQGISAGRLDPATRIRGFEEVVQTVSPGDAVSEARRCLSCGVCNSCGTCWLYCPEGAIKPYGGSYRFDLDYCKGCGICAQECPRGVVSLREEEA